MGESAFQRYTDRERVAKRVRHNREAASAVNQGELQFNHVFLDFARVCNLNCRGCYEFLSENTGEQLSLDETQEVIDYAKSRKTEVVVVAGAGEPTLDPQFKERINYIYHAGMRTVLFTNGTTVKQEIADFLIAHRVSPLVKLLSKDSGIHDSITGIEGTHKKAMEAIGYFIESKVEQESSQDVGIECYVSQGNLNEIPGLLKFCRNQGLVPYIEAFVETGQSPEQIRDFRVSQQELDNLFRHLQEIDKGYGIETTLTSGSPVYGGERCNKGLASFAVHENGLVTACAVKKNVFGNIRENRLDTILDINNPTVKEFYSGRGCNACSLQYGG